MRRGLLIDWGGVLTTSLFRSFSDFCDRESLDPKAVAQAFSGDPDARKMLVEYECGRMDERTFEIGLAQRLGVSDVDLADRLFEGLGAEPSIIEAVVAAKRAGVRTGLLSNSWGARYDRSRWDEMFDVLVISGELGIRKPDPEIYRLAAERLGLPGSEIVFVDDIPRNLEPAEQAGMATIHHTDPAETIRRLEEILGVELGSGSR
jgi:epoxide hydrolase-like predicted phosphatase